MIDNLNISILVTFDGKKYHAMIANLTDKKSPPTKFSVYDKEALCKGIAGRVNHIIEVGEARSNQVE